MSQTTQTDDPWPYRLFAGIWMIATTFAVIAAFSFTIWYAVDNAGTDESTQAILTFHEYFSVLLALGIPLGIIKAAGPYWIRDKTTQLWNSLRSRLWGGIGAE